MPFLMILSTVGFMFGTGGSAISAKTFGEGDKEKANRYFSLFVYTTFALGVLFAVLGIVFIKPIASALGAEGEMLKNAALYARIVLIALPFNVLQYLFQSFFVTAEKPHLGLAVTLSSGLTNMVLDAVLVILLPQEYKLAGAAVATAASQIIGGTFPLIYFTRKNSSILKLEKTKFDGKAIIKACTNGSSEFMSNVSMNLVGMLYNMQLPSMTGLEPVTPTNNNFLFFLVSSLVIRQYYCVLRLRPYKKLFICEVKEFLSDAFFRKAKREICSKAVALQK